MHLSNGDYILIGPEKFIAMARIHLALKEYAHAVERLRDALQLARKLGNRRAEANALAQLGQCREALQHLERSRQLQGNRPEIRDAEKLCRKEHGHRREGGHGNGLDRHPGDEG
jgi:tetratricopeptide (TPR) repeat protein